MRGTRRVKVRSSERDEAVQLEPQRVRRHMASISGTLQEQLNMEENNRLSKDQMRPSSANETPTYRQRPVGLDDL